MSTLPFTRAQLDAVDAGRRDEDTCIVAGPGSGKTTVLVEYFRRLVADAGVDPLRILAITFTEKAAGNMRKKLAETFRDDHELRARLERAWVSTVHGFCARLLRENAVFAAVDPEFTVLDERASWRMQQEAMLSAVDALFAERLEDMRSLIRGLVSFEFEQLMLSAYDTMRGAGVSVEELEGFPAPAGVTSAQIRDTVDELARAPRRGWSPDQSNRLEAAMEAAERIIDAPSVAGALELLSQFKLNLNDLKRGETDLARRLRTELEGYECTLITRYYEKERALLIEVVRRFDAIYRARKRAASALDFADLEEYAVRLLRDHPQTRERLVRQFDHILMDEFQDTNGQQAKLINLIRSPDRFYAVGDINQSIFGFRHAEPQVFQSYRADVARRDRRLVELEENFRSRADILSAVETLTDRLPGIVSRALVPGRKFPTEPTYAVETLIAPTPEAEAAWIAEHILRTAAQLKEIAILVRNTEAIGAITDALDAAAIPYVVNRGRGFYESREVNDLVHFLRIIANPRDEISMAVVLRSPLAGASEEDLLRWKVQSGSLAAGLRNCSGPPHLVRFRELWNEWRDRREYAGFDYLLAAAADRCGYNWSPNVDKFLAQAREATERMSLDEFVEELSIVRKEDRREADAPPEDASNTVKIMTVHSAKGLEFPVVFVAAMEKGVNKGAPVIAFSRRTGLGARWRNPMTRKDKADLFQSSLQDEWKQRDEEEASRLLYVAMTRAESLLVLSFSAGDRKPLNWAKVLTERLAIEPAVPRDVVVEHRAPDGEVWRMRLHVAGDAPPLEKREDGGASTRKEVQFVERPEISGQEDTNATVTALAKFAACPREYYLGTYLGYEGGARARSSDNGEADSDAPADELGTQVHALIAGEAIIDADPLAVRLAQVFERSELGKRAARAVRIGREHDFVMDVEGLIVSGQIDLWFEDAGGLVLVDYKTDDVSASEAVERARDYALQIRLYAMALKRMSGRAPDEAYLYFLRPDRRVKVCLAPGMWDTPEQLVRDFQHAQGQLEFALNEGVRCHRCRFYRGLCPATGAVRSNAV